jgi:CheY-like chemotaxis protein/HPt (histidine-containing phosphotransfer) domain-containing protein
MEASPPDISRPDQDDVVDEILKRLSQEFVETTLDLLRDLDQRIEAVDKASADAGEALRYIRQEIHNIKGQGSTFGFPLTGRVAHMLEDYLLNIETMSAPDYPDIRSFLDLMARLIEDRETVDSQERTALLNSLPTGEVQTFSNQKERIINVLLVMQEGFQRRLVANELTSCGFRVMRASDTIEAQSVALDIPPDVMFVNHEMTPYSGPELCHVFHAIDRLKDIHIALLTAHDPEDDQILSLPGNVTIVRKHSDFTDTIGQLLIDQGLFGEQLVSPSLHQAS